MNAFREVMNYSPSDIAGTVFSFIWTKLFFGKASLIRRPFHLRGKKTNLLLESGFTSGRNCRIELFEDGVIQFGTNCHIGDNVHIASSNKVIIGNGCLFASKIFISDTSHGAYSQYGSSPDMPPNDRPLISSFVSIGDNVWLGENVVVLPGTTIGNGCIVGANSTVAKDLPDNCIAVGSPAKPIKLYDSNDQVWKRIDS